MRIDDCIGKTPTVRLGEIEKRHSLACRLYAKSELQNPGGSIKDRVAAAMLDCTEKDGKLRAGAEIVTATSGNFGIALAMLSAARGYKAKIFMPSSASEERRRLIRAYGARIITPSAEGMTAAMDEAISVAGSETDAIYLDQFTSYDGVKCHYAGTGRELWEDMSTNIDIFITGVGTGATISGVAKFLKERKRDVKIIAVEPCESAVLSGGAVGAHIIEGIGAGFVPPLYRADLVDEIVSVSADEAVEATRELARCEGILAGISSGASLAAILKLSKSHALDGKGVAFILCDRGERYFSRGVLD